MLKGKLKGADVPEFPAIMETSAYWVGILVALFMFIAGYLYKPPVGKVQTIAFVKKKALHLLLPYAVFTSLIMLTSASFDFGGVISGNFGHLWFFTALFWCFMFSLLVDFSKWWGWLVLVAAFACSIVKLPSVLGISNFVQWYYFFALVAIVKSHPAIIEMLRRYHLWILLLSVYVGIKVAFEYHYRAPSLIHNVAETSVLLFIWLIFNKLRQNKWEGRNSSYPLENVRWEFTYCTFGY